MIREMLDDGCRKCGKPKDEADEIIPVSRGRYRTGPDWSCADCVYNEGGAGETPSNKDTDSKQ